MGAGLKRHIHRRPSGIVAPLTAIRQRCPLGVEAAQLGVESLAEHLAVAHNHGADQRIGTDAPSTALGKLQSLPQVLRIGIGQLLSHGH
jgi:hypothetical protein